MLVSRLLQLWSSNTLEFFCFLVPTPGKPEHVELFFTHFMIKAWSHYQFLAAEIISTNINVLLVNSMNISRILIHTRHRAFQSRHNVEPLEESQQHGMQKIKRGTLLKCDV